MLLLNLALTFSSSILHKETLYNRKATNGMQPNRKAKTTLRKHRGVAGGVSRHPANQRDTPSPSWVLFEADGATTTFRKAPRPKARANLYRKRTSSRRSLQVKPRQPFFVSFLWAQRNEHECRNLSNTRKSVMRVTCDH